MRKIATFLSKFLKKNNNTDYIGNISYSQTGEDLIINFILHQLKLPTVTYLDVGAHHPKVLSNTFYFYNNGFRGVNIEPDPFLIEEFFKVRNEDKNLNVGIGFKDENDLAEFFIMSDRTLSTFSREDAEKIQMYGTNKIDQIIKVPLVSINKIIEENFISSPNLVSIDIEGLDFEVLKTFDFNKFRPEIFCIETLTYTENKTEKKLNEIIEYLLSKNYFVYSDTYINTIFVDSIAWKKR